MKNLSLLNKLIYIVNIVFVLLWFLAFLAPYINPQKFSFGAILAIGYPLLLLTHILFALYWLVRFNRVIYLSLAVITASYLWSVPVIQTKNRFKALAKDQSFSILSYNTQSFYYLGGKKENVGSVKEKLAHYLSQQNTDIICLQEARIGFETMVNYPHKSIFGYNQIYSKYEIIDAGVLEFENPSTNTCAFADVIINYDTVRIYNLHLESFRLVNKDYNLIKRWDDEGSENEVKAKTQEISTKISKASSKRVAQINSILTHTKQSPYPSLLCGDFNDVSQSYIYRKLSANHTDAFIASGKGFGATFKKLLFPFRIDYILYPNAWNAYNFKVLEIELSDHQAIRCDIEQK